MNGIELISARDLDFYIESNRKVLLLDVRSREDFEKSHLRSAINIPYEEEEEWDLPRDKKIVVYCERGATSMMAARKLKDCGYRVASVIGGIREYRGRNLVFSKQS